MGDSKFLVTRIYHQSRSLSSLISSDSLCRHADDNKEKVILIWLDADYNESDHDYQISLNEFQHLSDDIYPFINPDVCIDFLTEINDQTTKLILIIDGKFANEIVPLIEDCSQLDSILVFRNDIHQYKQWSTNHVKIKGVFGGIHSLTKCLEKIISPDYFTMIDIIGPSNIQVDYLNTSFMYSQLLKEILLDIHTENRFDRESLIEYFYEHFFDKNIRDKFNTSYNEFSPIYWYSAYSFVYEPVNRALRTIDIDLLLKMSFFIGDLHKQIEELHAKTENKERLIVYRGQRLTKKECKKLEDSIGGFISFNCFLSTSTDLDVSTLFADCNSSILGCNAVLFEIEINPKISSSPYTSIEEYSQFSSENEILFSTHTIFRIDDVTVRDDGLYYASLSLTSIHDKNLNELIDHRRKEIEGKTSIHRLAHLLYQMGKFQQAKEVYQQLLGATDSLDDILRISLYLTRIDCHMGDFDCATSQQAIVMQFNNSCNPALTADVYAGMAEVFLRNDMLEDSLKLYEQAFSIAERSLEINDHSKVLYLSNIGSVLKLLSNYDEALACFQKALNIALTRFPSTHPDIANIYQNMGSLYYDKREFDSAISYLTKTLEVRQLSLPPDHPAIGNIHYNLSKVYTELSQWNEVIYHGHLAVDILKKTFSDEHFELREAQLNLDTTSFMQRLLRSSDTSQRKALAHIIRQLVLKMMEDET